ncbi:ATP-binding domain-containing protein [Massilia violaceinigra]|uniref:ATP-binding domain-containing protein n=1 Tax=Massilia violaceinigra TaxID=2045208 RepID=A0ABY4ADG2_9BURK|nr:ATP-binding domain-containing protein [Massilia violaceinigra]UOD31616.1 ATP-binding domain-containing protein [Massilia violaceinigra]
MAHIHPTGWQAMSVTGTAVREIETLTYLERTLLDAPYRIYHGVHWTNVENGFSAFGEIDFIVVAPSGRLLLIEQKSGLLNETADGLVKHYEGKPRKVANHLLRSIKGLTERFGGELSVDYLLYCPDYLVRNPQLAGIDPRHIIDATNKDRLAQVIREILPVTDSKPGEQFEKVTRFLGNMLSLRPDPSAMIGNAAAMVTRLSGGLASWARKLEFTPFRLRVSGTAGSGKTQLALAEYAGAIEAGLAPLYVCYNRPLADHIGQLVPAGGRVATFHMLSDAFLRAQGHIPDYAAPGVWDRIEARMAGAELPDNWKYDVLIVDEGQDFSLAWRDILLRMLKPGGRAIWLEDPNQNLYGRPTVPLPDWVTLHSDTNFRSPRQIIDMLASIGAVHPPVEAGSPFKGAEIEELMYPEGDTEAMLAQTRRAVTLCLGAGFARHDIAIASFRGREKSAILRLDKLSEAHTLHSFTGEYDLFGTPIYREGGLLAESVYRFKGQSAPAVIFTEIDFEQIDELVLRKLFVGMTRARLKLVLVMSERAGQQLLDRM